MQFPLFSGVYTDAVADFRTSYPVNLVPVPKGTGISEGYLRQADGLVGNGAGPGEPRGGINWQGTCYRAMGNKLVAVGADGAVSDLASLPGSGQCSFDYSFDTLAIAAGGSLFYFAGGGIVQVSDPDLGTVVDVVWIDGYYMTTDGEFLIVTELNDPTAINPLKYGSSEADPDPINALLRLRGEVYALNRHTIEVFENIGGSGFPFQRIEGAQIQKGVLGTHCCAIFMDQIAFLGSGRGESPAIYLGANAGVNKISTREIDTLLAAYTETELANVVFEVRTDKTHTHLWVRLPDRTLVFDGIASRETGEYVWFILTSALEGFEEYRGVDLVWCYDKWLVADSATYGVGFLDDSVATHFGSHARWEFGTYIIYNEGRGALVHDLELVCLTGRVAEGSDPAVSTSYSVDGLNWSQDRFVKVGKRGNATKRITWMQQGPMRNWRIQRFRGDTQAFISVARIEARLEPLGV